MDAAGGGSIDHDDFVMTVQPGMKPAVSAPAPPSIKSAPPRPQERHCRPEIIAARLDSRA
jgi:hypothetical protein